MSRPRPYLPASVLRQIREALEEEAAFQDFSQSYIIALSLAQFFKIDIDMPAAIKAGEPMVYIPRLRLPAPRPMRVRPSKTRH